MTVQTYPMVPTTTPLRGTLLDAATVQPQSGYRMIDETDALFDSYNCLRFDAETGAWCAPSDPAKTFGAAGWTHGFRFAVYGGIECRMPGMDFNRARSETRRIFEEGESTGVERALMRSGFVDGPLDGGSPIWDAATDITPAGGAVHPVVGMALLEGFMADTYVGVPTLHLPRTIASILASSDRIESVGREMYTKMGSKVAAGAGYDYPNTSPLGAAAAAGERWLYASGEVLIIPGELVEKEAPDWNANDYRVLIERPYMAALDCATVAIRVTLSA